MTIREFLNNLHNDLLEDGDTGVHLDMKLEDYLKDLREVRGECSTKPKETS
jgi:hypothetical protein